MKYGKTAVYTILKNEAKYIEKWLYYADPFDYKVLLDTGSTDGSWEMLEEAASKDPKLIIEQKIFDPWRFDTARRYNMTMIPKEVTWCLSPDLDEYYSINTHDEMEVVIEQNPNVTAIASDRIDVYSKTVRVGPPKYLPTNKIHLNNLYTWNQPIYEHISWIPKDRYEVEVYSDEIYLIHDQDFRKKERTELYVSMMETEYAANPTNTWNLWYLVYHYFNSQNLVKYIPAACDYLKYEPNKTTDNYKSVLSEIRKIYLQHDILTPEQRAMISEVIQNENIPFSSRPAEVW